MTTETVAVVDPRTGVAFKPEELTDELLAEILVELQRREHQMTEWRRAAEDEMVRRAGDRTPFVVIAGRQYDIERSWSRKWDVDDVEAEVHRLVHEGVLKPEDVSGLIKRTRTVDGRVAGRLLDRGSTEVVRALHGCFQWELKGRARVKPAAPQLER